MVSGRDNARATARPPRRPPQVRMGMACLSKKVDSRVPAVAKVMEVQRKQLGDRLLSKGRKMSAGRDQDDRTDKRDQHDADSERQFDPPKIQVGEERSKDHEDAKQAIEPVPIPGFPPDAISGL
jgi:hypothetical protein